MTKRSTGANLIIKAIDVLEAVGNADAAPRLTEIVTRTGLPAGTAHRILDALTGKGMLRRDNDRKTYRLGPLLLQMARGAWEDFDIRAAAAPEFDRLHAELGHTLVLAVLVEDTLVVVERRQAKDSTISAPAMGSALPFHSTAPGKAILSALDAAQLAHVVLGAELVASAPRTIIDPDILHANVELAASHHYAMDDEESAFGVRGCAAPILNQQGRPIAAIGFAGSAAQLSIAQCRGIGKALATASERISANLGYNPPDRWTDLAIARRVDGVERASESAAYVGIAPFWCSQSRGLYWGDRSSPTLRFVSEDGRESASSLPGPLSGIVGYGRSLMLLLAEGLYRFDPDNAELTKLGELSGCGAHMRFGVAACDVKGRLWITMMDRTLGRNAGGLYRVEPDFSVTLITGDLLFPVGLAWSPGNETIYFSDGPRRLIYAAPFDAKAGTIGHRRVFAGIPEGMGRPTGIATDQEGGVWNTQNEGWRITRYTSDGEPDEVVKLPVPRPIDCTFGGDDGRTLYITTARQGIPERRLSEVPLSGALLTHRTTVAGVLDRSFG